MGLEGEAQGGRPHHQGPGTLPLNVKRVPPEVPWHSSPNFGKTGCPPPTNGQVPTASGVAICEGGTTDPLRKLSVNKHPPKGSPSWGPITPGLPKATSIPGGVVMEVRLDPWAPSLS